ncbi:hypothetical protein EDEG_01373 [Edhazardia aedis USNM 41457]|uniref:Uncharacterized protein n=1 Tax=Edhazardia aedis (strain USNM 41457) TaxID=1003232 RepID=J9DST5_EDHAE|nr:hypothetical protein EDEG_01373 [Edhazardia aedis USNM 41457]|eukprot:EJW04382.1 hypothetical protein EDEG_01373 [Edhazardia aedis USNM 41457]
MNLSDYSNPFDSNRKNFSVDESNAVSSSAESLCYDHPVILQNQCSNKSTTKAIPMISNAQRDSQKYNSPIQNYMPDKGQNSSYDGNTLTYEIDTYQSTHYNNPSDSIEMNIYEEIKPVTSSLHENEYNTHIYENISAIIPLETFKSEIIRSKQNAFEMYIFDEPKKDLRKKNFVFIKNFFWSPILFFMLYVPNIYFTQNQLLLRGSSSTLFIMDFLISILVLFKVIYDYIIEDDTKIRNLKIGFEKLSKIRYYMHIIILAFIASSYILMFVFLNKESL